MIFLKKWNKKNSLVEQEKQKLLDNNNPASNLVVNSKILLLEDEIKFLEKVQVVIKEAK